VLETNLDDLSGELNRLLHIASVGGRRVGRLHHADPDEEEPPGGAINVLCRPGDAPAMEDVLFTETTTLGVRSWLAARHVLRRQPHTVATPWGPIEGKLSWFRRRCSPFCPRVRFLPPRCNGSSRAAQGRIRGGAKGI